MTQEERDRLSTRVQQYDDLSARIANIDEKLKVLADYIHPKADAKEVLMLTIGREGERDATIRNLGVRDVDLRDFLLAALTKRRESIASKLNAL